ncbi:MAG: SAM-dependent methyltransferase [Micromonosporaceae bacterium]|nr:SAM-dependent methyltransferase [Micromonosporaceae bacterium]
MTKPFEPRPASLSPASPNTPGTPGTSLHPPDWTGIPGAVDIGLGRPNAARIYDWLLGGNHHFAVDRAAGEHLVQAAPDTIATARANRAFLHRAVRHIITSGVTQILDLGSGIPTAGAVHDIAHRINPTTTVVYVDHDPVAAIHAQHMLADQPQLGAIQADLRETATIWEDPTTRRLLDPTRPVAILLVSVLHFVNGELDTILADHRLRLVPGSMLVISHATQPHDDAGLTAAATATQIYDRSPTPLSLRDRPTILRMFHGFDLIEPGLVPVDQWRPDPGHPHPSRLPPESFLAGVGHLPPPP